MHGRRFSVHTIQNGEPVWNATNESTIPTEIPTGTLYYEVSRDERANARANVKSPPDRLGPFRRELLLHLATEHASRPRVDAPGLRFIAKEALAPGVELTPSLASRISTALTALDDLGLIRRTHPEHGVVMVRMTPRGLKAAVEAAERWGLSTREYRDFLRRHPKPIVNRTALVEQARELLANEDDQSLLELSAMSTLLADAGEVELAELVARRAAEVKADRKVKRYDVGEQRRKLNQFAFWVVYMRAVPPSARIIDGPAFRKLDKLKVFRFTSERVRVQPLTQ